MDKRQFMGAALAASAPFSAAAPASAPATAGPALLTVSGAIARANRGAVDPTRDLMMFKQKVQFAAARTFDFASLLSLPATTNRTTLEYDAKVHVLRGPLLTDVLAIAGARPAGGVQLLLRGVDGYVAALTVAQARAQRFIVATHLDGQPMALGGLGPLWAIPDADRVPELAARPLAQRFGGCPWSLYHIDVA
ncbi:molybdopterin-dependent oxidoreductase [Massilia sp. TWP1-3-3]|uniref:molybdopterin-dependent oxidoreductase n=1 Tax=Massilia sp. TWP1-3-3 TaxID=2804573 RepID=UPI003CF47C5B